MSNLYGSLKLRPTRIGFLLRPTDKASLKRILRINTCLWGGFYNPIIPVCRTLPKAWRRDRHFQATGQQIADGYLEFFQPDVFVEAEPGLASACGIESNESLSYDDRIKTLDEFVTDDEVQRSDFAFGLNIFDLYNKLWREEFRFAPAHERRLTLTEDKSKDSLFVDAVSGTFPDDDRLGYIRNGYVDAFKPNIDKPEPDHLLSILEGSIRSPLSFTRYDIDHLVSRSWDPIVFIVDPASPLDIIDLWNLRLFHRNVLPFRYDWLDLHKDYLRDLITRNYRPLPRNRHGVMIMTTVEVGRSLDPKDAGEKLKKNLSRLPKGSWAMKLFYDAIWQQHYDDAVSRPKNGILESAESSLDLVVADEKEPKVQFRSLSPDFAETYGGHNARWANVLSLSDYSQESQWAVDLPSTTKKESYPRLRLSESLLVSREGLVLRQRYKDNREYIRLLTGRQAIVDWLVDQEIKATPSDSGRIADQIISAVGGFWGSNLFADEDTLRLLDNMAKSVRTFSESGTVEEYRDRTASADVWMQHISRRNEGRYGRDISIDSYVECGAMRVGLEVRCPNCENRNWYGITAIDDSVTCERCLKKYAFPQGSLNLKKSPWRLRVTGPFALPNFAAGAYATVLSLRCLSNGIGSARNSLTYSTNLNLGIDDSNVEIDFAGWFRREAGFNEGEEPRFFIGEAKSFASEAFTEKDTNRLKQVARLLPGTYLVFAVLKSSLSSAEKDRIKKLATWGRFRLPDGRQRAPVIVLTGKELLTTKPIRSVWKDAGGKRSKLIEPGYVRLDNLDVLADVTQQINLGMPSYWTWYRNRVGARTKENGK